MPTIVTDISKPLEWVARKAQPAALTINCLQAGSPFNISGYTFTAELFRVGNPTAVVTLTQGSGVTNGGALGTILVAYTAAQLDLVADSYRWYLKAVHPDTAPYQWLNAPFTLNDGLYEGSSDQEVNVTIDIGGTTIDLEISLLPSPFNTDGGSAASVYTNDQLFDGENA